MKTLFTSIFLILFCNTKAQLIDSIISIAEAKSIMSILASDSLGGRVCFTKNAEKTVDFITSYLSKNRIEKLTAWPDYKSITLLKKDVPPYFLSINNERASEDEFYVYNPDEYFDSAKWNSYHFIQSQGSTKYIDSARSIDNKYTTVIVLNKDEEKFANIYIDSMPYDKKFIILTTSKKIQFLSVTKNIIYTNNSLINVVGIIEGKTKPTELVLVSAHYDHVNELLGFTKSNDKIYNGANDNASGTTAVLLIAKYLSFLERQDRTIVFCLFGGEEQGLLGSLQMSEELQPRYIKSMINIEMIARNNKPGKNQIIVTGYKKSSLATALQTTANTYNYTLVPANEAKQLYERSDNFPFAHKGVIAHTFMTSTDEDKFYHHPSDDFEHVNFEHLINTTKVLTALIIKAASASFIIKKQ